MTDGPMGIQVAPITEDDMSKVHDILRRAADAIVGMSQLKTDVDDLTSRVRQTQDELDRYRRNNEALEEALSNTRQRRNELERRLQDEESQRHQAEIDRDKFKDSAEVASANLERRGQALEATSRERDDAQLRVMELEDELAKIKGTVDKIRDIFGASTPAVQASPAPPTSGPMVQSAPEATNPSAPQPDPVPTPVTPTRIYSDHWMPGSLWDSEKSRYYTELPNF